MAVEVNRIICSMIGVNKRHEKKVILRDINLSYFYGAKIGVLGLNGAGKSSLLRILAGVDKNFDGQLVMNGQFRIGFLEQEPRLTPGSTVLQCVQEGAADTLKLLADFDRVNEQLAEPMDDAAMNKLLEKQGQIQESLDRLDAWNLDSQIEQAMDALRCPDGAALVDVLSGGERRRVALCRLLLSQPDILLLDEPTNHLDAESVAWLEQYLHRFPGTVIAVTHDRYFLDNVAGWILELDRGYGIPWKGNYSSWLEQKQKRLQSEEKQEAARQKTLARELEWIRQSPSARRAKNKARITAYESLLAQSYEKLRDEIEIFIPAGQRLGNRVVEARKLTKAFGDNILYADVDFVIPPGAIVGIVGPNGSGKTTLLKMIVGQQKPDSGQLIVGESVQAAYVTQGRDDLAGDESVWQSISGGAEFFKVGSVQVNTRAYVSRFGFTGTDQSRAVGTLSGGERNRVHLARLLRSGCNVLLLDEPTNDLDVSTCRSLEDALTSFAGCVLVVSHDRWFLDRTATHILAFEGDSQVRFFEGNWSAYDADRHQRLGADADRPHRIKYRKLTKK